MEKNKGKIDSHGTLYVVATPIGNLEDITLRALRILKEVDIIAAEDTRITRRLLSHYQIKNTLTSYYEYNRDPKAKILIQKLKEGKNIALVTCAGTPGISDPGTYLIDKILEESLKVTPVPGASALIASLSISGFPLHSFIFQGFLPVRKKRRRDRLERLVEEDRTVVLYVSPHDLKKILAEIGEIMGNRKIVLTRELTKVYEEIIRGKVSELIEIAENRNFKGEITLVIEGKS